MILVNTADGGNYMSLLIITPCFCLPVPPPGRFFKELKERGTKL